MFEIGPPTLAEYIHGWRHVCEETSSSYSAIHFGHYIAGTQESQIAQFNAHMALLPAATGYSPSCWHHGRNVMLKNWAILMLNDF